MTPVNGAAALANSQRTVAVGFTFPDGIAGFSNLPVITNHRMINFHHYAGHHFISLYFLGVLTLYHFISLDAIINLLVKIVTFALSECSLLLFELGFQAVAKSFFGSSNSVKYR